MTKKIITILMIITAVFNYGQVFGQCEHCDKALEKDYLQSNSSIFQQLNVLKLVTIETFNEYKRSGDAGGNFGIGPLKFGASSSYDDFKQEREKLFQQYSYSYTESQAKDELRIVTNPIAYSEWNKCITSCYNNQANLSLVYGYITYADSNTIFVKVKYKSTATSKDVISCRIIADNGTILKEFGSDAGSYLTNIMFDLKKSEEIGFTIKRTSKEMNTTISVSSEGSDVFREVSKYSTVVSPNQPLPHRTKIGEIVRKTRSLACVEYPVGTNGDLNGGNSFSPSDNDEIEVAAPENGIYDIVAKGSYHNRAFTIVNVFLYIYDDSHNLIASKQIATSCNNFPQKELSGVVNISGIKLNQGDKVKLFYGNNGGLSEAAQGFQCAYPGDYIYIKLKSYE